MMRNAGVDPSSLFLAASGGEFRGLSQLLGMGVNPNVTDSKGLTPLHYSSRIGCPKCVQVLLEYGADPNVQSQMGETPLHFAAMNGHDRIVDILLKSGADASIEDYGGARALDYADYRGYDSLSNYLLPKSVPKNVTPETYFQMIDDNDLAAVQFALAAGVSPDYFNGEDYPVHYAMRNGHGEIALALIKGGCAIDSRSNGSTPLHVAAYKGLQTLVKVLLKKGADINDKNSLNGNTPLLFAMKNGKKETSRLLLQHGADVQIQNFSGTSPLSEAVRSIHGDWMSLFSETGALRRVNRDMLLTLCIQNAKMKMAFSLSVASGNFGEFRYISDRAEPCQLRVIADNGNVFDTLTMIQDQARIGRAQHCMELIDAL